MMSEETYPPLPPPPRQTEQVHLSPPPPFQPPARIARAPYHRVAKTQHDYCREQRNVSIDDQIHILVTHINATQ